MKTALPPLAAPTVAFHCHDPELTNRAPTAPGRSDIGFADGAFFIIPTPPATEEDPTPEQDQ